MNTTELLKDLAKAKRSQESLRDHLYAIRHPRASKFGDCGTYLLLRDYIEHNEVRVKNANFCKCHLLCQLCAIRRAARAVSRFLPIIEQVMGEQPALIPAMVTWTVKDGSDLGERFQHLKQSRMKYTHRARAQLKRKNPPAVMNEWTKVAGGILAYEIKIGDRSKLWHPHGHELVLLRDYLDQRKFSQEWHDLTGDSFVVGVSKVDPADLLKACLEVLKYVTKFSKLSPEQLVELERTLKGNRLLSASGVFRGVVLGDIDEDDDDLDGPWIELVAQWFGYRQGYRLRAYDDRPARVSPGERSE